MIVLYSNTCPPDLSEWWVISGPYDTRTVEDAFLFHFFRRFYGRASYLMYAGKGGAEILSRSGLTGGVPVYGSYTCSYLTTHTHTCSCREVKSNAHVCIKT